MSSRKKRIVKELAPEEVEGFPLARIQHYLELGYKPYLDEDNEVKWLTPAQRSLRGSVNTHIPLSRKLFPKRFYFASTHKHHHTMVYRFIREYWRFVLIFAFIGIVLYVLLVHPYLVF